MDRVYGLIREVEEARLRLESAVVLAATAPLPEYAPTFGRLRGRIASIAAELELLRNAIKNAYDV